MAENKKLEEKKEEKKGGDKLYRIQAYLNETTHNESIKKMMYDMFRTAPARTMDQWKKADDHINNTRVK